MADFNLQPDFVGSEQDPDSPQPEEVFFSSSNLESAIYNPVSKELTITFSRSDEYTYLDVPENVWTAFKSASSAGKFFHQYIKGIYG